MKANQLKMLSFDKKDFLAGISVFLVALPLCLGIALASNAPLFSGLVAGIVGGILVGMLSGSHTSVAGPAAGLAAVVLSQIELLGGFESFLTAVVLAGLIQMLLGVLRAGFISAFFPSSVIKGLLAAIGTILILKQIPHLFGHDPAFMGDLSFVQRDGETTFSELLSTTVHLGASVVGLISVLTLLLWDKVKTLKNSLVPSSVVVALMGVMLNESLKIFFPNWMISDSHLVNVPILENGKTVLDFISFPNLSILNNPKVFISAFTLAMVASLETLLNLEAVDKIDPEQRFSPPNRELFAQGIGNVVSGVLGGLPLTSVIVRSSVNVNAGAKTKFSAIFHGLLLLCSVFFIPHLINKIPLSCLAAILIMTGYKLANPNLFKKMYRSGIRQFLPFVFTVVAIVFSDLLIGIAIGLGISLIFILYTNFKRPLKKYMEHHILNDVLRIELSNQVSFFSKATLEKALNKDVPNGGHVLIDARQTDYIDPDVLDFLQDYIEKTAPARHVKVSHLGLQKQYLLLEDRIEYLDYTSQEVQSMLTPNKVLEILKMGNARFLTEKKLTRNFLKQVKATSTGQSPLAVVISCIDSRAPIEHIFDLGIGDIFSVRIAGNVAKEKVLGSVEFACQVAKAKLIVVLGHTSCGAVKASIDLYEKRQTAKEATGCENLDSIVGEVFDCIKTMPSNSRLDADDVAKANVKRTMHILRMKSKTIDALCLNQEVAIVGGMYDVQSGRVEFIEETKNTNQQGIYIQSLPV